jgi:hypothetical protein
MAALQVVFLEINTFQPSPHTAVMHQISAKSHFPFCLLFPSSYSTQGRESQKVTENSTIYIYISKKNRKMRPPPPKGMAATYIFFLFFFFFFLKKKIRIRIKMKIKI